MVNHILLKLNQYPNSIQSPTPSPDSPNNIINEWLSIFLNLFHSLLSIFNDTIPPETRKHWLDVAKKHVGLIGLGIVFLGLFCWCCLPAIISCILWVLTAVWSLISGFFMGIWRICRRLFGFCCCCCGRRSFRMMKAPGRGGRVIIPRSAFESNPRDYFINLHANRRLPVLR